MDGAGRPLVLESHPLWGHSPAGITLLNVNDRTLLAGDALGTQGPDAGLILREPPADFATRLTAWRTATDGRYDVVYTAHNFQWFTSVGYVDQVQEAVTKAITGGESSWIPSTSRPGTRLVRSSGAADLVASVVVEQPR